MAASLGLIGICTIAAAEQEGSPVANIIAGSQNRVAIKTPPYMSGTCRVEVLTDENSTFLPVNLDNNDLILLPGRFVVVWPIPAKTFRVFSDVPEAEDRLFEFWCILET